MVHSLQRYRFLKLVERRTKESRPVFCRSVLCHGKTVSARSGAFVSHWNERGVDTTRHGVTWRSFLGLRFRLGAALAALAVFAAFAVFGLGAARFGTLLLGAGTWLGARCW
jgi:hypothetical protein